MVAQLISFLGLTRLLMLACCCVLDLDVEILKLFFGVLGCVLNFLVVIFESGFVVFFPRAFLPWPTLTDNLCACRLLCCSWGETLPWLRAIFSLFLFAFYPYKDFLSSVVLWIFHFWILSLSPALLVLNLLVNWRDCVLLL